MIKRIKHINAIIILLASLLFIVFVPENIIKTIPYSIENITTYKGNNERFNFFHDFDKDGYSELISINKHSSEARISAINISNSSNIFEEAYNFFNTTLNPDEFYFDDINGDGYDELFVFHHSKDTIYMSLINHKLKKEILRDIPVVFKPQKIYSRIWDPVISVLGFNENDKEHRYLYFIVRGLFSIFPRTLYKYDLVNKEIVKEFKTGSPINGELYDLNKDGNSEIILRGYASNNCDDVIPKPKYDDLSSWFFVLDENLNLLWHKQVQQEYSHIMHQVIKNSKDENEIILFNTTSGDSSKHYNLQKYNSDGALIQETNCGFNRMEMFEDMGPKKSNSLIWADGEYYKVNEKLELIPLKVNYPSKIGYMSRIPIDNLVLWLRVEGERTKILDENLNILGEYILTWQYGTRKYPVSIGKFKNEDNFSIVFNDQNIQISGELIPITNLDLFYKFGLGLLLWLFIVQGIYALVIRINMYIKFINFSTTHSDDLLFILNESAQIKFANKTAIRFFNLSGKRKQLKLLERQLIKYPDFGEIIKKARDVKRARFDEIILKKDNEEFRAGITVLPLKIGNFIIAYVIRFEDKTKTILKERAKVWGHTVQKMAHEIKTPLSSILLNVKSIEKSLSKENSLSQEYDDDIQIAKQEIDRIKTLTNNLLKFANLQKPKFRKINLENIISIVATKFQGYTLHGVEINTTIEGDVHVYADEYQMVEVLQILIENAIDALNGKGKIEIIVNEDSLLNVVNVYVIDHGCGISEEDKNKIFDPYFTSKKEGTGMGLAIAKKIIEDHGGKLVFETEINKGTKFQFQLKSYKEKLNG